MQEVKHKDFKQLDSCVATDSAVEVLTGEFVLKYEP